MQRLEKRWQATALENERYSGGKGMSLKLRSFASLRGCDFLGAFCQVISYMKSVLSQESLSGSLQLLD